MTNLVHGLLLVSVKFAVLIDRLFLQEIPNLVT